jgi:cysteinyl-tRNA synthetase
MHDDDAVKVKQILEWAEREGKPDKITPQARAIAASSSVGDADIDRLVSEMQEARKAKNFSRADAIRSQLNEQGIIVEITKDGARWRRK